MATGPKGQKRRADVIGNAIKVAEIATGEEEDEFDAEPEKNQAAARQGRRRRELRGMPAAKAAGNLLIAP